MTATTGPRAPAPVPPPPPRGRRRGGARRGRRGVDPGAAVLPAVPGLHRRGRCPVALHELHRLQPARPAHPVRGRLRRAGQLHQSPCRTRIFLKAMRNTAYFVIVGIPLTMIVALAAAVALNSGITRFRTVFRVGFYTPVITSIVAVAVVWRFLLQPDSACSTPCWAGSASHGPNWLAQHDLVHALADPDGGRGATWAPAMIIFLAGLQTMPEDAERGRRDRRRRTPGSGSATSPCRCCGRRCCSASVMTVDRLPAVLRGAVRHDQGRTAGLHPLRVACTPTTSSASATTAIAAAMSYILFVVIALVTAFQFRLLRENT